MNKLLIRLVALALIPCLIADLVTASAFSPHLSNQVQKKQACFSDQALMLRVAAIRNWRPWKRVMETVVPAQPPDAAPPIDEGLLKPIHTAKDLRWIHYAELLDDKELRSTSVNLGGSRLRYRRPEGLVQITNNLFYDAVDLLEQKTRGTAMEKLVRDLLLLNRGEVQFLFTDRLSGNAARFIDRSKTVIFMDRTFFGSLTQIYKTNPKAAAWLFAERLFHEFGHSTLVGSPDQELSEEVNCVYLDALLDWTVLYQTALGDDVNAVFKTKNKFNTFPSGVYFGEAGLVGESVRRLVEGQSEEQVKARIKERLAAMPYWKIREWNWALSLLKRHPTGHDSAAAPPFRKTLLWRTAYFALRHLVNLYAQYPNKILYAATSKMALPFLGRLSLGNWDPEKFYVFRLDRLRVWGGFDRGLLLERDYDPKKEEYVESKPARLIRNNSIDIRAADFGAEIMAGVKYRPVTGMDDFIEALRRKLEEESSGLALDPNNEEAFFRQGANLLDSMRQLLNLKLTAPLPAAAPRQVAPGDQYGQPLHPEGVGAPDLPATDSKAAARRRVSQISLGLIAGVTVLQLLLSHYVGFSLFGWYVQLQLHKDSAFLAAAGVTGLLSALVRLGTISATAKGKGFTSLQRLVIVIGTAGFFVLYGSATAFFYRHVLNMLFPGPYSSVERVIRTTLGLGFRVLVVTIYDFAEPLMLALWKGEHFHLKDLGGRVRDAILARLGTSFVIEDMAQNVVGAAFQIPLVHGYNFVTHAFRGWMTYRSERYLPHRKIFALGMMLTPLSFIFSSWTTGFAAIAVTLLTSFAVFRLHLVSSTPKSRLEESTAAALGTTSGAIGPSLVTETFDVAGRSMVVAAQPGIVGKQLYARTVVEQMPKIYASAKRRNHDVQQVLDLGTGRGTFAIALALLYPNAHVVATEVLPEALELALSNAKTNGVRDRFEGRVGDLLGALRNEDKFDIVMAGLPSTPIPLDPGIRGTFEPHRLREIDGGPDGRKNVDRLIEGINPYMTMGGALYLTHNSMIGVDTTLARLKENGFEPHIMVRTRRYPDEHNYTTTIVPHAERELGYSFPTDESRRKYYEMVTIEAIKIHDVLPAAALYDLSDLSKPQWPLEPNGAVIEPLPLANFTPQGLKGALAIVQAKLAPERPGFIELCCRNVSEIVQFDRALADPKLVEIIQQLLSHSDIGLVVIVNQKDLQVIKFEHFHLLPPDHPIILAPIGELAEMSSPPPERPEAFSAPQADGIRKWLSQASERLETVAAHWQEAGLIVSTEELLRPFQVVSNEIRRALWTTWTERGRAEWEMRAKGHLALSELLELLAQDVLPSVRENLFKTSSRDITRYFFDFASQTSEKNLKAKLSIRHETAAPRIAIRILSRKEDGHDWSVVYRMGADQESEEAYPIALPQLLHVDVNSSYRILWQHKIPLTAAFSESDGRHDALAGFYKFSGHLKTRLKTTSTIPDGEIEDSWRAKEIAGALARELHLNVKDILVTGEEITSPKEYAFPYPQVVVQNQGKPIARLVYQIDRDIPSGTGLSIFPRQIVMDASVPQASVRKVASYLQAYVLLRHHASRYYASAVDLPYAKDLESAGLVEPIANPSGWAKDAGFPGAWFRVRQDDLIRFVEGDPFNAALGVVQGLGGESDGRHFLELAYHFELVHRALRWLGLPSDNALRQEFVAAFMALTKTNEYRKELSTYLGDYKGATTEEKTLASYIAALDANPAALPTGSAVQKPSATRRAA